MSFPRQGYIHLDALDSEGDGYREGVCGGYEAHPRQWVTEVSGLISPVLLGLGHLLPLMTYQLGRSEREYWGAEADCGGF